MEDLLDITDQIIPDEEPKFFNEEEALELYETCIHLMEEFINDNPKIITEPDFDDIFDDNIAELMKSHFDFDIFYNDDAEEEMEDIIEKAKNDFFKHVIPPRSYPDTFILGKPNHDVISTQINILQSKPQEKQKTEGWYKNRHNLITASNAYKAFENQTTKNQLIFEKCQPLNPALYINDDEDVETKEVSLVNIHSSLHWGQKYEPLSVFIYEHTYDTKIADFGCIQHDIYKFLGASPDGINVCPKSDRYGRMLEIKNVVSREIDGIPKKEYWIQMQLQMEVCNLDECDFLETKFVEYPDYSSYINDTYNETYEDEDGNEFQNLCLSKDNKMKGQIIYFHTKEGKPFYLYKPIDIIHPDDITEWQENSVEKYQNDSEFNYTFMKIIYWKLDVFSCVLVLRNKQWFQNNINEMADLWQTVEKERISGYDHRAPNRKQKMENGFEILTNTNQSSGCLLQFNKDTGKITIVKKENDIF
jgi:putative phage-type endonuclease